jgi:hypothetical protein
MLKTIESYGSTIKTWFFENIFQDGFISDEKWRQMRTSVKKVVCELDLAFGV